MLNGSEIIETVSMLGEQNLDVRTVTLALSLFDCIDSSKKKTADKVYEKIALRAEHLVGVCEEIEKEYGVKIVNKRVSVTPIAMIGAASGGYIEIADALENAAVATGVDFVGGYGALIHKGMTSKEREFLDTIPTALARTKKVCGFACVASTRSGINLDAIKILGEKIVELAVLTDGYGCGRFVVFANAVEDNPFMAGAFNGVGEGDAIINVGVSGPGVVKCALEKVRDKDISVVAETVKKTAFKITRVGRLVAQEAAKRMNARFGIVDLSLAPTPKIGDSVAHILEEMGLESVGAAGTTACLAILNDAVKKGGVMASDSVGGLSGAFIPVSEDIGMINAVRKGALPIEKLEAMTAVCSVGLDMIAVPGDTPPAVISAVIADECAIGVVNGKTTAVRIIPAIGLKTGEEIDFGGLLGTAPVMSVSKYSPEIFINRGGRIPAPLNSLKN